MTPEEETAIRDFYVMSFAELARVMADRLAVDAPACDGPEALRMFSCAILVGSGIETGTKH